MAKFNQLIHLPFTWLSVCVSYRIVSQAFHVRKHLHSSRFYSAQLCRGYMWKNYFSVLICHTHQNYRRQWQARSEWVQWRQLLSAQSLFHNFRLCPTCIVPILLRDAETWTAIAAESNLLCYKTLGISSGENISVYSVRPDASFLSAVMASFLRNINWRAGYMIK